VVTVWIALDDVDDRDIGTLQYISGSHLWENKKNEEIPAKFFDKDHRGLLLLAAKNENVKI